MTAEKRACPSLPIYLRRQAVDFLLDQCEGKGGGNFFKLSHGVMGFVKSLMRIMIEAGSEALKEAVTLSTQSMSKRRWSNAKTRFDRDLEARAHPAHHREVMDGMTD